MEPPRTRTFFEPSAPIETSIFIRGASIGHPPSDAPSLLKPPILRESGRDGVCLAYSRSAPPRGTYSAAHSSEFVCKSSRPTVQSLYPVLTACDRQAWWFDHHKGPVHLKPIRGHEIMRLQRSFAVSDGGIWVLQREVLQRASRVHRCLSHQAGRFKTKRAVLHARTATKCGGSQRQCSESWHIALSLSLQAPYWKTRASRNP